MIPFIESKTQRKEKTDFPTINPTPFVSANLIARSCSPALHGCARNRPSHKRICAIQVSIRIGYLCIDKAIPGFVYKRTLWRSNFLHNVPPLPRETQVSQQTIREQRRNALWQSFLSVALSLAAVNHNTRSCI